MRVLLAGGGTGGHLYPVLSLARALCDERADDGVCWPSPPAHEVLVAGSHAGVDGDLLRDSGLQTVAIDARPFERGSALAALVSVGVAVLAALKALPVVARFRPDVVVGAGGYASVPVVLAAATLRSAFVLPRVKIVLLEPNVVPGRANRLLARVADEVWGAFPEARAAFGGKYQDVGVPVRREFAKLPERAAARRTFGLAPDKTTVLVVGGSQGARTLNTSTSAMAARRRLPRDWQVLHICGRRDYEWMAAERKVADNDNAYHLVPYIEDMASAYAAADVVIARAGASTVAELAAAGVPAILVPYPFAADGHQQANAASFERRGAAVVLDDAEVDADVLYWTLINVVQGDRLPAMSAAMRASARPSAVTHMLKRLHALSRGPVVQRSNICEER